MLEGDSFQNFPSYDNKTIFPEKRNHFFKKFFKVFMC